MVQARRNGWKRSYSSCNLKPVKLRGVESQGMILAAGNDGDDLIVPVATGANDGCEVR